MTARSELDKSRLGVGFCTSDARELGVSRSRLQALDLVRPFWGTRQLAESDTLPARCIALLSRLSPQAAISHSTAARLLGMPLPARFESGPVHVTVPLGERATRHTGVVGHQRGLVPADIRLKFGVAVTGPSRTWCDLAELVNLDELVAAGDFLVHWRTPLTTLADLADYSNNHVLRRGARRRREALPLLSERAESYRESLLRVAIHRAGFPPPDVNFEVFDARGRFVARVDVAWPDARVAVEYEGDHHRTDRAQWQRDLQRFEALSDLGWRAIRVSADDLYAPAQLFARLRALLLR